MWPTIYSKNPKHVTTKKINNKLWSFIKTNQKETFLLSFLREHLILFFLSHELYYDPEKLFISLIFINSPYSLYKPLILKFFHVSMLISLLILIILCPVPLDISTGKFHSFLQQQFQNLNLPCFLSKLFLLKCFYCNNWPNIHSHAHDRNLAIIPDNSLSLTRPIR